jgi:hypothetical protein
MHISELPPHAEADFLKALTQGANGTCSPPPLPTSFPFFPWGRLIALQFDSFKSTQCRMPTYCIILFIERILDERKSMFPYTDEQAQRFMQVYRDLKSKQKKGV